MVFAGFCMKLPGLKATIPLNPAGGGFTGAYTEVATGASAAEGTTRRVWATLPGSGAVEVPVTTVIGF